MIGDIISGISNIVGGFINSSASRDNNAAQMALGREQMAAQKEFAQSGIQWRAEDAKKAGIHPLYAIGANTPTYSPVSVSTAADTSMGDAISRAGQDIGRAVEAGGDQKTRDTVYAARVQDLTLQRMELENAGLATDLIKKRATNPAVPTLGSSAPGGPNEVNLPKPGTKRTYDVGSGYRVSAIPTESQQDDISKEYGDEGLPQLPGQIRFLRDAVRDMSAQEWRYITDPNRPGSWPNNWRRLKEAFRNRLSAADRRRNWSRRGYNVGR